MEGLRGRILDLCAEAARGLGFDPTVAFDGPIDSLVSAELGADVLVVLREALSNVSRHAGAHGVEVRVKTADGQVEAEVTDDGVGIDESAHRRRGQGLANMRARAERRGGRFELAAPPGGGSALRWWAPLS
jgi:signal transduction histidine kinase